MQARRTRHTDDIVVTNYIVSRSARRLGFIKERYRLKSKACVNRKEPGQPLKISDNKIESLIQCQNEMYTSFTPIFIKYRL